MRARSRPRPDALRALLQHPAIQSVLQAHATELPPDCSRWLGQLALLHGVPFNNLVADARMLPPESIRFFYIDQNWLDSLIDGALSVANLSSLDGTTLKALRPRVKRKAEALARVERLQLRLARLRAPQAAFEAVRDHATDHATDHASDYARGDNDSPVIWSGFLMRSAAVQDWPGLTVTAYSRPDGTGPLNLLRLDRPSPTVMVAIFDGIGRRFDIAQPFQALHFGVLEAATPGTYRVGLRGLGGKFPAGRQMENAYADVPMRANAHQRQVIDVKALVGNIKTGLEEAYGREQPMHVTPGAFGIEMVAGAERVRFFNDTAETPPVPPPAPAVERPAPPPDSARALLEDLRHGR